MLPRSPWVSLALAALALLGIGCSGAIAAVPPGLLFHASFDTLTTNADVAQGDPRSSLAVGLDLRSAEGIKGTGLRLERGERCSYSIPGNLDTRQGTFSIWVKPLNWDGHSGKFRHFLAVTGQPGYVMLLYLYPIGDEAVIQYINLNAGTPEEATWSAGAPVEILQLRQWTHLVSTWDSQAVRVYANGKRVGEGRVAAPLPKLTQGEFTICPIDFWQNAEWGDPEEQTLCDEVRVFDRALTDEEVLDLYAHDLPGGLKELAPRLAVTLTPDYAARVIEVGVRGAHLTPAWEARLKRTPLSLSVHSPQGASLFNKRVPLPQKPLRVPVGQWQDGEYTARARLAADGESLQGEAKLVKPPTPWLPGHRDWKADRVLSPWKPLTVHGQQVRYWNGTITFSGALPARVTAGGQPILAAPVRLVAEAPATWEPTRITGAKPHRVGLAGKGRLGRLTATFQALVEFDGLIRTDLTLTPPAGGVALNSLTIEIPLRPEVATYYRNPVCQPWDGNALEEKEFLPYAWLGNEERGLSWFMESAANWRIGRDEPALTVRREGQAVVVRLRLISTPTRVTQPLTYTIGFEATPIRPPDPGRYGIFFASGPQFRGSNTFVYGWGQQIAALNGRLIAYDPPAQRKLIEDWRTQGKRALSYTCLQCTANLSPEYHFFGAEWNQPYGSSFSGYKRVPDEAPYSIVPVCPQSSFADFLLWCAGEHLRQEWGDGIYTDIDAAVPCDNRLHGCGYTDAFGATGRTWPLYAHRGLSRRLYALCRDAGKPYFSHAHSHWYSLFNAFNDG
ncbi:MAG: LamG domain-containing protein, partial [Armatimonadetes bacterium]|nr:LamG domain-containing protein [Armatimonadota bacterium]